MNRIHASPRRSPKLHPHEKSCSSPAWAVILKYVTIGRVLERLGALSRRLDCDSLIPNAVQIAETTVDKQAQTLLMPVAARRQLNDLPDDLWTRIGIEFYKDASDAVFKALVE